MRSLALIALGTFVASVSLTAQSLAEHAAAAAGATVGTAAGKPLGTALGKIFGDVDNSTAKATGAKVVKPPQPKVEVTRTAPAVAPGPAAPMGASGGSGASGGLGGGSGSGEPASASTRHTARRRELAAASEPVASAPITPLVEEPVVKEHSVEEIAAVKVGATSTEVEATLGAPESRVSIPDDDGHLLEICQYWSKGQQLGTVRLDNGRVVSVQTRSY
jgi:hypothetical protein